MSGWLLDVNVLLGCGWKSHADHPALLGWLLQVNDWATCPLTESGFMRISMTTAYQATFDDARKSLTTLRALRGHRFLSDDVEATLLPVHGFECEASALVALASSGRALSEQRPISERAAKPVKIPVKLRPQTPTKPL